MTYKKEYVHQIAEQTSSLRGWGGWDHCVDWLAFLITQKIHWIFHFFLCYMNFIKKSPISCGFRLYKYFRQCKHLDFGFKLPVMGNVACFCGTARAEQRRRRIAYSVSLALICWKMWQSYCTLSKILHTFTIIIRIMGTRFGWQRVHWQKCQSGHKQQHKFQQGAYKCSLHIRSA